MVTISYRHRIRSNIGRCIYRKGCRIANRISLFVHPLVLQRTRTHSIQSGSTLTGAHGYIRYVHRRKFVHDHIKVLLHFTAVVTRHRNRINGGSKRCHRSGLGSVLLVCPLVLGSTGHTCHIAHCNRRGGSLTDWCSSTNLSRQRVGRNGHIHRLLNAVVASIFHHHRYRNRLQSARLRVRSTFLHRLAHKVDTAVGGTAIVVGHTAQHHIVIQARHGVSTIAGSRSHNRITCNKGRGSLILNGNANGSSVGRTAITVGHLQGDGISFTANIWDGCCYCRGYV